MGAQFGPYKLGPVIGTGVHANVFRATHEGTGAVVALKLVTPKKAGSALDRYLARLAQEADCLKLLNDSRCPGVPRFIEYGEVTEKHGYIAMELLEGETLTHLVKREGKLSRERSLEIAYAVARAITYANSHGIIHRDIKPDNIFILKEGGVRVLDFGISIPPPHKRRIRTNPDVFMGTAAYASPHHGSDSRIADGRDEAWSMSAVLYLMLTGTHAYPHEDACEVRKAIHALELPPRGDLDDAVWRIISRGLSDRAHQYPSAKKFLWDIKCAQSTRSPHIRIALAVAVCALLILTIALYRSL